MVLLCRASLGTSFVIITLMSEGVMRIGGIPDGQSDHSFSWWSFQMIKIQCLCWCQTDGLMLPVNC